MDRRTALEFLKLSPPWEWPETARDTLHEFLRDRNAAPPDRLTAAELAGDTVVIDDEGAELLLSIVGNADEPDELRARAAVALGPVLELVEWGEFEDPIGESTITEDTYRKIVETLRALYADASLPKKVRRRILEASVRSPQDWHRDAIRAAYASRDEEWKLSAVFGMQYVRGFDAEILESLNSRNPDIHYEAVRAAGNSELDAAWPHVVALVDSGKTPKRLLLAAIEAVGNIRPAEAADVLLELADSEDEDIAEAADEAMSMAEARQSFGSDEEDEDEEEDEEDEEDEDGGRPS